MAKSVKIILISQKKINIKYVRSLIKELLPSTDINPINLDRKSLNTKLNNEIVYLELELNSLGNLNPSFIRNQETHSKEHNFIKYNPVFRISIVFERFIFFNKKY